MPIKFCDQCGTRLKENAVFCANCGSKIEDVDSAPVEQRSQQEQSDVKKYNKRNQNYSVIVLIALFGVAAIIIMYNMNKSKFKLWITPESTNKTATVDVTATTVNITVDHVELSILSPGGELIPVLCRYATSNIDTMILWVITNKDTTLATMSISAIIPSWSNRAEKTIGIPAKSTARIPLLLTFKKEFYHVNELTDAQINYKIKQGNIEIWADSRPIKIAAKGTMLWSLNTAYDNAKYVAAFVNPHDPKVEEIISLAKEKTESRKLLGYQLSDNKAQERETYIEAKAMFGALGEFGLSYVNSPVDFSKGNTQRIRTPYESITQKSANCIDGAVLYASLFENLGMEPVIILGPGHAYVAVRCWPGANTLWFIETTMTSQLPKKYGFLNWLNGEQPDDPFKRACNVGWETYKKWRDEKSLIEIDIKQMRKQGILPAFTE